MDIYKNDTNMTFIKRQDCINGYSYPVSKERTFVTEWDLVCNKAELAEFSQTLVIIGQATGAAIFTSFADRYGRKPVHIFSHIGIFAVALGMAFVQSFTVFSILRFVIGTFQQGIVMTSTVMALETLPKNVRYLAEIIGLIFWTSGVVLLTPFGYLFRNLSWRYMQMALALYSTYSLFQYWILEESLRWLVANGKNKEIERIIRKAAQWNNVKFSDVIKQARIKMKEEEIFIDEYVNTVDNPTVKSSKADSKDSGVMVLVKDTDNPDVIPQTANYNIQRYTFFTILKTKRLFFHSLILWYTWIVDSLTYFGLTLFSSSLSGNRFLNFFLTAIMEYPAAVAEYFLINRIGRKRTCIFFHAVSGISLLIATILTALSDSNNSLGTASTAFTLIGKFGIAGSFSTIFLYTPELYPTNLRNVGIGVSSSVSRIGGMLAPFSGPLAERVKWAPGAIFGSMCMLVTFLCTILPETKGRELPQTLEDLSKWYSKPRDKNTQHKKDTQDI